MRMWGQHGRFPVIQSEVGYAIRVSPWNYRPLLSTFVVASSALLLSPPKPSPQRPAPC